MRRKQKSTRIKKRKLKQWNNINALKENYQEDKIIKETKQYLKQKLISWGEDSVTL